LPSNWHATNDLKTDVLVTHGHKIWYSTSVTYLGRCGTIATT
jgi:hypothetical protein